MRAHERIGRNAADGRAAHVGVLGRRPQDDGHGAGLREHRRQSTVGDRGLRGDDDVDVAMRLLQRSPQAPVVGDALVVPIQRLEGVPVVAADRHERLPALAARLLAPGYIEAVTFSLQDEEADAVLGFLRPAVARRCHRCSQSLRSRI